MAKRRFRSGFGQPTSPKPNYMDDVDPTMLRGENAPGTGDMACGAARGRWPFTYFLDNARGWGVRAVGRNIQAWEAMIQTPSCDRPCKEAMEENIVHSSDYIEKLAEGVERKAKWCHSQGKVAGTTKLDILTKTKMIRDGLRAIQNRQEMRGFRRRAAKKLPATSWVFPVTLKPQPECTDRVLGSKIQAATEMVGKAEEIADRARKDRMYNQTYFRRLMLAQGALKRLDLEASDCVKWGHPPSREVVEARKQLEERIEGLRHSMSAMAGMRKRRR